MDIILALPWPLWYLGAWRMHNAAAAGAASGASGSGPGCYSAPPPAPPAPQQLQAAAAAAAAAVGVFPLLHGQRDAQRGDDVDDDVTDDVTGRSAASERRVNWLHCAHTALNFADVRCEIFRKVFPWTTTTEFGLRRTAIRSPGLPFMVSREMRTRRCTEGLFWGIFGTALFLPFLLLFPTPSLPSFPFTPSL